MRKLAGELGLKPGQVFEPVRVAVTGRTSSLPLNESMEIIGKQKSLERIQAAADLLEISKI
jgi:glutamyl-tRNA synthetase